MKTDKYMYTKVDRDMNRYEYIEIDRNRQR